MNWFKIFLTAWLSFVVLVSLYEASKGKHQTTLTPGGQALSAVIYTLIIVGIWLLL